MTRIPQPKKDGRPSPAGRIAAALLGIGLALAAAATASAATPVQKVVSPGGIEAWLIESHEVGLISLRFSFEGGALAEPVDKPGVAQLMSYLFNEGAGDMDSGTLSRRRQSIGVGFAGFADYTDTGVTFTTPSAYRAEGFALLRLALHRPRFDADAIERARREYEATLTAEAQSPGSIASNQLRRKQFGDTRLATAVHGTLASLKQVTREDIEAYRRGVFARNNLKIAVAGDIAPGELAPLLDDLFGSLPARTDIPAKPSAPPQSASAELTRMELPQTVVLFGNTAPRLTWRQSLAFAIGNQILSGGFTGRLFSAIREKRGLVYSISAQRFEFAETSVFVTAFGAGSENVRAALDESRREIARFLDDGVSDEEVAAAKEAFLGSFFLGLDTNDKLVSQLLAMLRNDLPITYLDDYAAELEKITPADVMSAVRLVIRPEITNVVVVGNPPADFRLVPAAASATE